MLLNSDCGLCVAPLDGHSARIVFPIDVFKAKRPNRRHLRDVLAGFRPMEVGGVAGKNDHRAGRIGVQLLSVELITNPM